MKTAVPMKINFTVPNIDQFTEQFGFCAKQIEVEKEKIPGSTMRVDNTEFTFI